MHQSAPQSFLATAHRYTSTSQSLVTTIRSRLSARTKPERAERLNRDPEPEEQTVLRALAEMLRPTTLEPFKPFERPWVHGAKVAPGTDRAIEIDRFVTAVTASLDAFADRVPDVLKFHAAGTTLASTDAVCGAMVLRVAGDPYTAICLLAPQVNDNRGTADLALLHYSDTLWDLGLHGPAFRRASSSPHDSKGSNKIKIAIEIAKAIDGLFGGGTSNFSMEQSTSPDVMTAMYDVPPRDGEELYALIVYCHLVIIGYRYTCLVDDTKRSQLMVPSGQAASRLRRLWQEIKDDITLDNGEFLRWRCATAVRESLPFSHVNVGHYGRLDYLSLWNATDRLAASVGNGTIAAFRALRDERSPDSVQHGILRTLEADLNAFIRRKDLRAIDELLLALQMPLHADFYELQKATRRASWKLHQHMMSCSPWIMDGALLHPLSLWIGEEFRCGRTKNTSWYPAPGKYPGHGALAQPKTSISRLHISFAQLSRPPGTPPVRQVEDGATFIYAWSILYWALQYTSSPLQDEAYRLIFKDHEVFSFSQLFNRVRQVCRYVLVDQQSFKHLSLNGFDNRHRQVAGLGSVRLAVYPLDTLHNLAAEVTGLEEIRDELSNIAKKSPSAGWRHLAGMLLVYEGFAHVERAEHMLKRLDEHGQRASSSAYGPSTVKSELLLAKGLFDEVLRDYEQATLGEIARQAGKGLIRVQDLSSDLDARVTGTDDVKRRAQDMLELCNTLRVTLRSRIIEAYAMTAHHFEWRGKSVQSLSTGVNEPASTLYEVGHRSLHLLEQNTAAFDWLSGASEDWSRGQRLQKILQAGSPRLAMPGEPVLFTEGVPSEHRATTFAELNAQAAVSIFDSIWSSLAPEIGRGVIVQFSLSHPERKMQVHLQLSDGTSSQVVCDLTYEEVLASREEFYQPTWNDGPLSALRILDPLVSALNGILQGEELVILVPGPLCRAVLLHALEITSDRPLAKAANVVYAPDLRTFASCLDRGRGTLGKMKEKWRATASTVWESGGSSADVAAMQSALSDTIDVMARQIDLTKLKHDKVTKAAFSQAVRESECLFFMGHGGAGVDQTGTVYPPNLILHGDETFEVSDFQRVPASMLFLLACSTAQERDRGAEHLSNLADAALSAGAVSAVGTRIVIFTDADMRLAEELSIAVGNARKSLPPDQRFNLAEALRRGLDAAEASIDMNIRNEWLKSHSLPVIPAAQLWGAFMQVGSPLIDLHYNDTAV